MRKAMENVEKHYAVVGVLEDLNKTLTVLEHYIPRVFKGAKDVYYSKCVTMSNDMKCQSPPQTRSRSSQRSTGTSTSPRCRRRSR